MGPRDMEPGEKALYVLVVCFALALPVWGVVAGWLGSCLN